MNKLNFFINLGIFLEFFFVVTRSFFATALEYELSCTVVGPLALTHLSCE